MGMNGFQKFGIWLFNIPQRTEYLHSISEDLIKSNKKVEELSKAKASLESQIAKIKAIEVQKKESKSQEEQDNEIAKTLQQEGMQINKERIGNTLSLKSFFNKILRDKKYKDFEIADKNDETSYKFGDILLTTKGFLVMTDSNGKIRSMTTFPRDFIYKPESILSQVKRKRFLTAADKDGEFIPEIDDIIVPQLTYDEETKSYQKSKEIRKSAREIIIDLDTRLRDAKKKNETLEMTTCDLREENRDLKQGNDILRRDNKLKQTAFSEAINQINNSSLEHSEIQRKIVSLTETKTILELENSSLKGIIEKLLNQLEETGSMTQYRRALAIINEVREFERVNPPVQEDKKTPVAKAPQ